MFLLAGKTLTGGLKIVEGAGVDGGAAHLPVQSPEQKNSAPRVSGAGYEIALQGTKTARGRRQRRRGFFGSAGDSNYAAVSGIGPDKSAETIREGGWIYTGRPLCARRDGFHFFNTAPTT